MVEPNNINTVGSSPETSVIRSPKNAIKRPINIPEINIRGSNKVPKITPKRFPTCALLVKIPNDKTINTKSIIAT